MRCGVVIMRGMVTTRTRSPRASHPVARIARWSFPERYPIVQFPNVPLVVAIVAGLLARPTHGTIHAGAEAVEYLGIAIWAYLELVDGVNAFRRVLGAVFVVVTVVQLTGALPH